FPQPLRLVWEHAAAAYLVIEQAANKQCVVAYHLGLEAESWSSGQQTILRILLQQLRRDLRRLPIHRRRNNQALHRFHIPLSPDELRSQPIQQLLIAGRVSLRAEVLARFHDSDAE